MRDSEIDEVRALHLFDKMAAENFAALVRAAYLQRLPAQVALVAEGDRPDFLHVILEGSVELFSELGRRRTTIASLRPLTTFILAAVVGDLPYLASARTSKASRILLIPADAVREMSERDNHFGRAIAGELARAFRGVLTELKNQKLRTGLERLALWILRTDAQCGGGGRFTIGFDKRALASLLGMTPENLSRNFKMLGRAGVEIDGRVVSFSDRARLAMLANAEVNSLQSPDWA